MGDNSRTVSELLNLPAHANNDFDRMVLNRVKNSSHINIDKWGKSKDMNILYITGLSGSGKSTVASYLADNGRAKYINLDSYLSPMSEESKRELQDKDFNRFLKRKVPEYRNVIKSDYKLDYKIVDKMADAVEEYGKQQYLNGNKVIVEGVQLYDNTLFANNASFSGKPMMVCNTNPVASNFRGSVRDSYNLLDAADLLATRFVPTAQSYNTLKQFKKELGM